MDTSEKIDGASVILESRYGGSTSNPTRQALEAAIRELYVEDLPGMTEGDYEEHGAAFLSVGFDDGPMYVLEVTRFGNVRFEEWADQDYETPLAPRKEIRGAPMDFALQLWLSLAEGYVGKVRNQQWRAA